MDSAETNKTKIKTPPEKLYDLGMIEQLCRGNQEEVKKMVWVFINQAVLSLEEIKLAYAQRDFAGLKSAAHKIKPSLTYYGITVLQNDIQLIEILAQQELAAELKLPVAKLHDLLTSIIEKMQADL